MCSFDFYQSHDDNQWSTNQYQTYYVSSISEWLLLITYTGHKKHMNKLPFHEQLRIQFKSFNPNNFSGRSVD